MDDNSIENEILLSQSLIIRTRDNRIIGERQLDQLHEITIIAVPNIAFFFDVSNNSRTAYFNYYWAVLHDYGGCFSAHLYNENANISEIKPNTKDTSLIEKAIHAPYNQDAVFTSSFQVMTPDEYLSQEGSMRQFLAVAVYDSGEYISAYDWRNDNRKLRMSVRQDMKIKKSDLDSYKDTVKELEMLFPGTNWK